jgi:ribosome-binding ATPase
MHALSPAARLRARGGGGVVAACSRRSSLASSPSSPLSGPRRHASYERSAGLVGLPSAGKSTLFNALCARTAAEVGNFPFTTITPNIAPVAVPDPRLAELARLEGSQSVKQQQIVFHDIAGLIAGASKGEGLGNAFLGNIRAVSCMLHVVRCYEDPEIIHVLDTPDPARDIGIIDTELILADLQSVEKRLGGGQALRKAKTPEAVTTARLLEEVRGVLESGLPARSFERNVSTSDLPVWDRLQLLTQKPVLYLCNVGETHAATGNAMTRVVADIAAEQAARDGRGGDSSSAPAPAAPAAAAAGSAAGSPAAAAAPSTPTSVASVVCAKLEAEAALLPDADRVEFLSAYGLEGGVSGLDAVIRATATLLRLHTFYTVGPTEARAWTIPLGATAPQAAGVIHGDLESGFIKAELVSYADIVRHGGDAPARKGGAARNEGKEYVMRDGDVAVFKFAPPKKTA